MGLWHLHLFVGSAWYSWSTATGAIFSHSCFGRHGYCHIWRVGWLPFTTIYSLINVKWQFLFSFLFPTVRKIFFLISYRCGEDERPLNELLVLQLGAEHPNGRYNISMCKVFGTYWNQEQRTIPGRPDTNLVQKLVLICCFKFLFIMIYVLIMCFEAENSLPGEQYGSHRKMD